MIDYTSDLTKNVSAAQTFVKIATSAIRERNLPRAFQYMCEAAKYLGGVEALIFAGARQAPENLTSARRVFDEVAQELGTELKKEKR